MRLKDGGYPFEIESLEFMQNAYKKALENISLIAGSGPVIIQGVNVNGTSVSDGVIIYNKEVLPFIGGTLSANVIIYETIEQVEYNEDLDNDGNLDMKEAHVQRFAKCGVGGVLNFPFAQLKRVRNLQNVRIVGEIIDFAGRADKVPAGWLPCDGRFILKADYPELYSVIGDVYGHTSTSFRLPSSVDRMAVGAGNKYALGAKGGSDTHVLSISEMPRHDHYVRVKKGVMGDSNDDNPGGSGNGGRRTMDGSVDYSAKTEYNGSGNAHNNMPPYIAFNKIIFVGY